MESVTQSPGIKYCPRCKTHYAISEFAKNSRHKSGVQSYCKDCKNQQRRDYYKGSGKTVNRDGHLRRAYGIDAKTYAVIMAQQDGKCAICGRAETGVSRDGKLKPLAVDHDHKTGKVRGLLCGECNRGIGSFRESLTTLVRAMEYLSRHV